MNGRKLERAYDVWRERGLVELVKRSFRYIFFNLTSRSKILRLPWYFVSNGKTVILFGADRGLSYRGNTKAVFEHFLHSNYNARPIWMTRSEKVFQNLKEQNKPVVRINSLKGLIYYFNAPVHVTTHSTTRDVGPRNMPRPKSTKHVYLAHGNSVKGHPTSRTDTTRDIAIAESRFQAENHSKQKGIPVENYHITGYPRNDQLLTANEIPELSRYDSVVLYAPTRRKKYPSLPVEFFPFPDFDKEELLDYINDHNICLLLRPHPDSIRVREYNKSLVDELCTNSDNIELATIDRYQDVNELLQSVDLLLTDYSSIYIDFLLLDRPIGLIPYDFECFKQKEGFIYDYFDNLPGPVINSHEDLIRILNQLVKGQNIHSERRRALRNKVHKYQDANSTQRVAKVIVNESLSNS